MLCCIPLFNYRATCAMIPNDLVKKLRNLPAMKPIVYKNLQLSALFSPFQESVSEPFHNISVFIYTPVSQEWPDPSYFF